MFDWFIKEFASVMTVAVMAVSDVAPVYTDVADIIESDDLTYQSIELYPNGEESEEVVTLDGFMPAGAEAEAVDVSEEHDGIAAYDITITDSGEEYQPGEENPILVEISDPAIPDSDSIELWHIHDDGEREQICDFTAEEGKISFYATGFSVYQIAEKDFSIDYTYEVETPDFPYVEMGDPGWNKVKDLRTLEIDDYKTQGFYICFSLGDNSDANNFGAGRFLKDSIVEKLKNDNRKGVGVTGNIADQAGHGINDAEADFNQIIQSATNSSNGAVRYFFEKNTDGTYYISYKVSEVDAEGTVTVTDYYITVSTANGQNSLIFTTSKSADAKWVLSNDNGNINLYNSSKNLYWGPTWDTRNANNYKYGIASTTLNYGGNTKYFNIWYEVPATSGTDDPYKLDGKPYGLVISSDATTGYAMSSAASGNNLTGTKLSYDAENGDQYAYDSGFVSGWTFNWDNKNQYYLSCGTDQYLKVDGDKLTIVSGESEATRLSVIPGSGTDTGRFVLQDTVSGRIIALDGSSFRSLASTTNKPHYFNLVKLDEQQGDPYDLDGKSFGLMNYHNAAYGYTMQAKIITDNNGKKHLISNPTQTRVNPLTHNYVNFVTADSDPVTFWQFEHMNGDYYQISGITDDGSKQYLNINLNGNGNLQISSTPQNIRVLPGSGTYENMIRLWAEKKYVQFGSEKFSASNYSSNAADSFYLNLVEDVSMLISNDFVVYTAKKVGVAEHENKDPDQPYVVRNDGVHEIIIYTRVWDADQNRYRFYAIDHDGKLVECFERGDNIMWIGNQVNSLKWEFTEYLYDDGTTTNYYDLYNPYSGKYIVPQLKDGQVLVTEDQERGINMPGRRDGEYYTQFIKWDEANYAFSAVRSSDDDKNIESCKKKDGDTFYFAYLDTSEKLTPVETVDNTKYGITMKMVDFNGAAGNYPGCTSTEEQDGVMGRTIYDKNDPSKVDSGLLSTNLINGYPTAVLTNQSLGTLFDKEDTHVVNHLFIQSTLSQSGYFEFDSCQNFATLKGEDDSDFGNPSKNSDGEYLFLISDANGNKVVKAYADPTDAPAGAKQIYDFRVTKELGTYDSGGNKPSLKHGQFLPYDGIEARNFGDTNGWNLYDALQNPLSDTDPRKYEQLYKIDKVDNYFGMELEASFIQTPDGTDNWKHPIIFEFTGDDDFWLYVDGELVIDLGGVHSAVDGTVNFATGEVVLNSLNEKHREEYTLRELFASNYRTRNPEATDEEVDLYLDGNNTSEHPGIFKDGGSVFNDYTQHTMTIFYMERGAGASNLHMRFNISSVNPGSVMLTKQVGTEDVEIDGELDENLLQFPYQIWFATNDVENAAVTLFGINHPEVTGELTNDQKKTALSEFVENAAFTAYRHNNSLSENEVLTAEQEKVALAEFDPADLNLQMLLTPDTDNFSMGYQQSARPIRYEESFTDNDGLTYPKVFFLYPGMSADIRFPEDTLYYMIRECGIDSDVYSLTEIAGGDGNTNENGTTLQWTQVSDRPNVVYKNKVARNAFKPLRITKVLKDEQDQQLAAGADNEVYTFRLYLTDGISNNLKPTNMYKYHVRAVDMTYCIWNPKTRRLEPLDGNKKKLTDLTPEEIEAATFETSINGAISNIPIGFTVEVPNLPLHSYFMVEERADETPMGCKYLEFSDHGSGYTYHPNSYDAKTTVMLNGETYTVGRRQCAGQVPEDEVPGESIIPWVEVNNKRGWELHANKIWSDKDFVKGHDTIYTAIFLKNSDGTETLLNGSIRELRSPDTEVWYYYDKLVKGYDFEDYAVYEVDLHQKPTSVTTVEHEVFGTEYQVTVADNTKVTKKEADVLYDANYMRNWELLATKDWSQGSETEVYTAVYLKNTYGPDTLLEDSIRRLDSPDTDVSYIFEDLEPGHTFSDYAVYEVALNQTPTLVSGTENKVTVEDASRVTQVTDPSFSYTKPSETGSYRTSYDKGMLTGGNQNVRSDTITNTRQGGLIIYLYEMGTAIPLKGGIFELKKDGDDTLLGEYVSDADGLVTVMYDFALNQDYILTEKKAPNGYLGVPNTITIRVNSDDSINAREIIVDDGDENIGWATGNIRPTEELVAEVKVYNPKFEIKFKKVDAQGEPLGDAVFSLYRCVINQSGAERMDYVPMDEFKDQSSDVTTGIIFDISVDNNNMLRPGKYYLYEEKAPINYIGLEKPIKFEVSDVGEVTIFETLEDGTEIAKTANEYLAKEGQAFVFTIPNTFSKRDYYFDIEKTIYVDKNVHDGDQSQKFVFKVEHFAEDVNLSSVPAPTPLDVFYVSLNCGTDITTTYMYPFSETTVDGKTFNPDKTITCEDGYCFPAAVWTGKKTVHVMKEGIYRVSEESTWSSTDYDLWGGSNVYKGYGNAVRQGQSDGCVIFNVSAVKADQFKTASAVIDGETVYRPTASFTNTETEYAYLSSQAYAENTIRR